MKDSRSLKEFMAADITTTRWRVLITGIIGMLAGASMATLMGISACLG